MNKNTKHIDSYDYDLPRHLIAQHPAGQRDASKMLVLDRKDASLAHTTFTVFPSYLQSGDLCVFNNTKVVWARCYARKKDTGARLEVFFTDITTDNDKNIVKCLVKPGKRIKEPTPVIFEKTGAEALIEKTLSGEDFVLRFRKPLPFPDITAFLEQEGHVPLPPYIHRAGNTGETSDKNRYQTVYASHPGAVAAPTAGLHFTKEILSQLHNKNIGTTHITLHVGIGTFKPVTVSRITDHVMHKEHYEIPEETVQAITRTKKEGGRVVCIGTTTVRTLEHAAVQKTGITAGSNEADIFIYPGYEFKMADTLLTNFHLPRSTLLMMTCAFAGHDLLMQAYKEAVEKEYRFYSYGDCMLIL